jgi:hypothetical protein
METLMSSLNEENTVSQSLIPVIQDNESHESDQNTSGKTRRDPNKKGKKSHNPEP